MAISGCSAASKSAVALSSHCLTNWRSASSGGFIEDSPVLPGGIGDPSNEVLRFFETRARHHDDVDWIAHVAQRPANPDAAIPRIGRLRLHYKEIEVAIFGHLARRLERTLADGGVLGSRRVGVESTADGGIQGPRRHVAIRYVVAVDVDHNVGRATGVRVNRSASPSWHDRRARDGASRPYQCHGITVMLSEYPWAAAGIEQKVLDGCSCIHHAARRHRHQNERIRGRVRCRRLGGLGLPIDWSWPVLQQHSIGSAPHLSCEGMAEEHLRRWFSARGFSHAMPRIACISNTWALAHSLHFTEPEVLEVLMNRTALKKSFTSALPALALGAVLMLFGPTAALAQRGGGGHGGHFGGGFSGHSFAGGGHAFSAPRGNWGGGRSYVAPNAGRGYYGGRGNYGGGHYGGGGSYYPGRFYAGRGYYYGGRFWARPYFGLGIGIPFGWGYNLGYGCGYYDGFGYWQPAPCYSGY